MSHLRRVLGFAAIPGLSVVASLILLPLISRGYGADGWVALGFGQSVGAIISVIGGLAWPLVGGHLVARDQAPKAHVRLYRTSVLSRAIATGMLLPPAFVICLVALDSHQWAGIFFMIGIAFNAMSAGWFFSGVGHAGRLILNEGVPRVASYLLAIPFLLTEHGGLLAYAVLTTLGGMVSLTLNWLWIVGTVPRFSRADFSDAFAAIRDQTFGGISRTCLALFSFGGPLVYSVFAPSSLALFTALDQMQKAGINSTSFLPQALVAWVGRVASDRRALASRARSSMLGISGLACLGLLVWCVLAPAIADLLFAGNLDATRLDLASVGLAISITLIVRSYELLVLVPVGHQDQVFTLTSLFSAAGLIGMVALSRLLGGTGGVWAWTIAHLLLLATYLLRSRAIR